MNERRHCIALSLLSSLLVAGCNGGPGVGSTTSTLGYRCEAPIGRSSVALTAPALECLSRLCYLKTDANNQVVRSLCTEHCVTDEDCAHGLIPGANDPGSVGLCTSKFLCVPVGPGQATTSTGQSQSVCTCQDDLPRT